MRDEVARIVKEFGFASSDPNFSLPDLIEFSLRSFRTLDGVEEAHLRAIVYAICLLEEFKEKRRYDRKWARFLAEAGNPDPRSRQDVVFGGRRREARAAYKYVANKRLAEALLKDPVVLDRISGDLSHIGRIIGDEDTRAKLLNPRSAEQ